MAGELEKLARHLQVALFIISPKLEPMSAIRYWFFTRRRVIDFGRRASALILWWLKMFHRRVISMPQNNLLSKAHF